MPNILKFISFVCFFILFEDEYVAGQGLPIPIGVGVPGGGVGVGVPTNALTDYPVPYANKAADYRSVYLIRAFEMGNRQGLETAIRSIFFDVKKAQGAPLFNFTIRMRQTSEDSLTLPISDVGLQTVYGPLTYVERKGLNEHRFDVPFCWDGVSNIVVDICVQNQADDNSLNATVTATVPDSATNVSYHDWADDGRSLCQAADALQPKLYTDRPLMYWSYIGGDTVDLRHINAPMPGAFMELNSTQTVDFEFQNYGCKPVVNPILVYQWNDEPEVIEQWIGTIMPGEHVNYTFSEPITAYETGFNSLTLWTDDPNDVFRANDTIKKLTWVKDTNVTGLDYTGTEFWLAFMRNYDNGPTLEQRLFITSGQNASVNVSLHLLGWSTQVNVPENNVVEVIIPNEVAGEITATEVSEEITRNGILVTSDNAVSVYGYSGVQYTADAFLAIPSRTIGTEYVVMAPTGIYNATGGVVGAVLINAPAELVIVAPENNTEVTIIPSAPTEKTEVGDTIKVVLNRGETYLVQAKIDQLLGVSTGTHDLSGTVVSANKQIAVLSGAQCGMMPSIMDPNKCDACDHLIEQMTPTDTWGKAFYFTDFDYKPGTDILRIMSASDQESDITINGTINVTIPPRGEFYDYQFDGNTSIASEQPIQVSQFCTGAQCEPTSLTDPFYTNIIPVEQWGNYYTFTTAVIEGFDLHYINIIKKGAPARVGIDSKVINPLRFTQIAGTEYYAGKFRVSKGSHIITSDSLISVYVYGFGRAESYGYPSSGSFLRRLNVDSVEVDIDVIKPSCNQTTDGRLKADIWYGSPPFKILWSTGDTSLTINNIGEGTYWVKVTDLYGYTNTDTVVVTAPDRLEVELFSQNLSCFGADDGLAWTEIQGGSKPYKLEWQTIPPSSNDSIFNLSEGWYVLKVQDNKGCEVVDSVQVLQPDVISVTVDLNGVSCFGGEDGTADINADGGVGTISIEWPQEGLTQVWSRVGMETGSYQFVVSDENGCKVDSTISITAPTKLAWYVKKQINDQCEQGIGSVEIGVEGGTPGYEVNWNNGASGLTINSLHAGWYVLTVRDANDCVLTDSLQITTTEQVQLSEVQVVPSFCENGLGSAEVSGARGNSNDYQFKWHTEPPQYGTQATNLDSGLVKVTLTDLNCSDTLLISVDLIEGPTVTFTPTNPTCGHDNGSILANVSGGNGSYSYSWNSNPIQTSNLLTGVGAGTYKLTLTDDYCTISESINLLNVNGPQAYISTEPARCGNANGEAVVSISGGTGSYQLRLDGGSLTADTVFSNLGAGTHTIMVDDGVCQLNLSFDIEAIAPPTLFVNSIQNSICGYANGAINVGANNGSGVYAFSWADTTLTTKYRNNLAPGNYKVLLNDGHCIDSLELTVGDETNMSVTIASVKDALCGTGAEVYATASGGNGNYNWLWKLNDKVESSLTLDYLLDVVPGNHQVKITDGTCVDSIPFEVNDVKELTGIASKIKDAKCNLPNGAAKVEVSGGTGNYSVNWSGVSSDTLDVFNNMLAGFYNVEVNDGTCQWQDTLTIANIPGPKLQLDNVEAQRCGKVNGRADVSVVGSGTVWWELAPKEYQTYIKNKPAGNYVVFVSDGVCQDSLTVTIPYYQGPDVTITTTGASCNDFNGSAVAEASGGTPPYNYLWRTFPAHFDSTADNLAAGNYVLELSDQVCTVEKTFNIADLGSPVINVVAKTPAYCEQENGTAEVIAYGGSGIYSYEWETNPIQYGASAINLSDTIYKAKVWDGYCGDYTLIEIEERGKPEKDTTDVIPAHCGEDNGSVAAIPFDDDYTIKWLVSDSVKTWQIDSLAPGTYNYVIYNEWCSDTFNINVGNYALAELESFTTDEYCSDADGTLFVREKGTYQGNSSILWETGDTTFAIGNLKAGDYVFTWRDQYCEIVDTLTLIDHPRPIIVIDSIREPVCDWKDGFIAIHGEGGEGELVSEWKDKPPLDTNYRTNLGPGEYHYEIRDANNCDADSVIRLRDMTPVPLIKAEGDYCERSNGTALVVAEGLSPVTITWHDDSLAGWQRNNLASGIYNIIVTDVRGCTVDEQVIIRPKYEFPEFKGLFQEPLQAFVGDRVILDENYPGNWHLLEGTTPEGDSITAWPFVYEPETHGSFDFKLVYQSNNGCLDTLVYKLFVDSKGVVYVPSAFSPDSQDDLNSVFKIYGQGIQKVEGGIFDRWGELIRRFEHINDVWDGTFNGKLCKPDVYSYRFYITDINGNLNKAFGTVTLIR